MTTLKALRNPAQSTPDLLNWDMVVDDGVVLCKDGSLLAGWYYTGADLATASAAQRDQISEVVNRALASLGSEFMVHVDASRIPARAYPQPSQNHFPDKISTLIDEERRHQFLSDGEHFETLQAITLNYLPPKIQAKRIEGLVIEDDKARSVDLETAAASALATFHSAIQDLEDRLASVIELQRMRGVHYSNLDGNHILDELLTHLRWTLTGELGYVNLPPVPMHLDAVISPAEIWTGLTPKLDGRFFSVVAIDGFPQETYSEILAGLDALSFAYRWSTRWICQDAVEAQSELKKYRRQWSQRVRGFFDQLINRDPTPSSVINADAAAMVVETDVALAESNSGMVGYGYYTSVIVLFDEQRERLDKKARIVRRLLLNIGFGARVETVNTVEAWLGSLPGHAIQNVRRPMLHTLHLANLLPLSSVNPGAAVAPNPMLPEGSPPLAYAATEGSTPFRLNLHVHDVGHSLVFGPTGAGKSTLLAFLAVQFLRYERAQVFVFDKGHSMETLTRAVGGIHSAVDGDANTQNFAPLASISDRAERLWASEWVEGLLLLQGLTPTASQRAELNRALESVAQSEDRTLTKLRVQVQDTALKEALLPYTSSGIYSELLDAKQSAQKPSYFRCWEIGELMNKDDRIALPVLLHLFRVVERALDGRPTLLVLDEAWMMLGHPVFREKIREWLKTLRKANACVVMATQSLSDASRSGILDVLVESCATTIYLPNAEADLGDSAALYGSLGLSETELALIKAMTPKRDYYVRNDGRRRVDLALGPVALAFTAVSSPTDLRRVRALHDEFGVQWPFRWLEERGVSHAHL